MRQIYKHKYNENNEILLELIEKNDKVGTFYVLDLNLNYIMTNKFMSNKERFYKKITICKLENVELVK